MTEEELKKRYGRLWNTQELQQDYEVISFLAPFVIVKRKLDGVSGMLAFQHMPRFYFDFIQTEED